MAQSDLDVGVCSRCLADPSVTDWTRVEVRLLRLALRMSLRDLADYLGVSHRMISKWESEDSPTRLRPASQAMLDTALARADEAARRRFGTSLYEVRISTECSG